MPFEADKNATELGVDKSRNRFIVVLSKLNRNINDGDILELIYDNDTSEPYFRNLTQPNKGYNSINWSGLGFSCCWSRLEYADEPTLPPYIICSTRELARQVLEKIERDFPDERWWNGEKITNFIPSLYYPGLVIYTNDIFIYSSKEYFENNYKGEHLTTAEEYLGIDKQPVKENKITLPDISLNDCLLKMQVKFAEEYLGIPHKSQTNNPEEGIIKKSMKKLKEFVKNIKLSDGERAMIEAGMFDDDLNLTSDCREMLRDLVAKDLGYKDYNEMESKFGGSEPTVFEYEAAFKQFKDDLEQYSIDFVNSKKK